MSEYNVLLERKSGLLSYLRAGRTELSESKEPKRYTVAQSSGEEPPDPEPVLEALLSEAGYRKVRSFAKPGAPKKKKIKKGTSGQRAAWRRNYRKKRAKLKVQRKRRQRKPEFRRREQRKKSYLKRMGESAERSVDGVRYLFVTDLMEAADLASITLEQMIALAEDADFADELAECSCQFQEIAADLERGQITAEEATARMVKGMNLLDSYLEIYEGKESDDDGDDDNDDDEEE